MILVLIKKKLIYLFIFFTFISCSSTAKPDYLHTGLLIQENFFEEISFEYTDDLIYIDVCLNSNPEIFKFILDTGAGISVISPYFAEKIGPGIKDKIYTHDINGTEQVLEYGLLDKLSLGTLDFKDIPVLVHNLDFPMLHASKLMEFWGCLS